MAVPVVEQGYAAESVMSAVWWSNLDAEQTPELRWPLSIPVYEAMHEQESQVASVLRAVTLPIRRTGYRIDGTGCDPRVTDLVSVDIGLPVAGQDQGLEARRRTRDRFSFHDHLRLALLELRYGHSFFEQLYRPEGSLYRLRKLAWRPPRTITKFDVARDGGLVAIYQADARIGVERLVAYVNEREGANWIGRSLLRSGYKYWLLKDQMLRVGAQTVKRNGMGVPIYTGANIDSEGLSPDQYREAQEADLAAGLEIAAGFRSGDNAGAAIANGAQLRLTGVEGRLPDALPWIKYYDTQIARAALAHFLNLGGDDTTGSYALGDTFAEFFGQSLQTGAQQVADVFNQHVIEDLVDVNFGPDEPAPRLVFDEIGAKHPATAEAIRALVDCGVLTPDEPLETHIRTAYSLPAADPATAAAAGPPAAPPVPEENIDV